MDETQYRQTYQQVNRQRCVFEKALQTRQAACSQSHRFCLADREGVSCTLDLAHKRCHTLVGLLRRNANFALGLPKIDSPLPHNKEIKIQVGGLLGIQQALSDESTPSQIEDVHALLTRAIELHGSLENIPFEQVVKFIVSYEIKRRRRSG
jgi:hypothetical protein